jgi:hypothetical protein
MITLWFPLRLVTAKKALSEWFLYLKPSVAEVRFSSVLGPFFENRELNRWPLTRTELEPEPNRQNRFCLFGSVPEPVRTDEPPKKIKNLLNLVVPCK